jgi:DnaK suppressor protein
MSSEYTQAGANGYNQYQNIRRNALRTHRQKRPMDFTKKQLDHFKTVLLDRREALLQADETGEEAEKVVELDQTRVGRLSRMDAMQAQAMSLETGRRRRLDLVKIEAALRRLDEGEFGECLDCAEAINPNRLEADPTATLCIGCAEAHE